MRVSLIIKFRVMPDFQSRVIRFHFLIIEGFSSHSRILKPIFEFKATLRVLSWFVSLKPMFEYWVLYFSGTNNFHCLYKIIYLLTIITNTPYTLHKCSCASQLQVQLKGLQTGMMHQSMWILCGRTRGFWQEAKLSLRIHSESSPVGIYISISFNVIGAFGQLW